MLTSLLSRQVRRPLLLVLLLAPLALPISGCKDDDDDRNCPAATTPAPDRTPLHRRVGRPGDVGRPRLRR